MSSSLKTKAITAAIQRAALKQGTLGPPQLVVASAPKSPDANATHWEFVPCHRCDGAREMVLQDTKVLPVLKLLASLPDEPGASHFTPAHLLPAFTFADNPEFELDLCKPSYESLVVCNAPAAVAALAMPHNIERVQQASRIIVVLFLSKDDRDVAKLSDALMKDPAINQACRDSISKKTTHLSPGEPHKYQYKDTVFAQRALGHGLLSQLLYVFRNDLASKQLSFAIFRDTHNPDSTGPASRDMILGPSMDSWQDGACQDLNDSSSEDDESMSGGNESLSADKKDISLVIIKALVKLQSPDVPVYVIMETEDDEDLDKVRCTMRNRGYRNVVPRKL
ncbi:hypothetical protein FIE12Z_12945 [Fusarium flagelliforme]|uniref:Uncharacterized protein n=1 Tax=Fusarium flagelliforme TaxID=2675880 RepID=A0A395M4M0_9HYPO|nr:hypothetical protein FIE12Z_12945 [Fusarium flagelliforme]